MNRSTAILLLLIQSDFTSARLPFNDHHSPSIPSSTAKETTTNNHHIINLSYQSHIPSEAIAKSIRDRLVLLCRRRHFTSIEQRRQAVGECTSEQQHCWNDEKVTDGDGGVEEPMTMAFEIDISSSLVGDDGMDSILDVLPSSYSLGDEDTTNDGGGDDDDGEGDDDASNNSSRLLRSIGIQARMNRLTPKGVISLFNRLIAWGEREREMNGYWADDDDDDVNSTMTLDVLPSDDLISRAVANATKDVCTSIDGDYSVDGVLDDATNDIQTSDQLDHCESKEDTITEPSLPLITTTTTTTSSSSSSSKEVNIYLESIDLGFNNIGVHGRDFNTNEKASTAYRQQRTFLKALEKIIANKTGMACPRILRMDRCCLGPSICRSIGRGIIDSAISSSSVAAAVKKHRSPSHFSQKRGLNALYLSGNIGIGDSGAVALAAALKLTPRLPAILSYTNLDMENSRIFGGGEEETKTETPTTTNVAAADTADTTLSPVLEMLDVSVCGIGDTGAEALAIAIATNPGCIKSLDLSGNLISDEGAVAIGNALQASMLQQRNKSSSSSLSGENDDLSLTQKGILLGGVGVDTIDLSNNKNIGDDGASELAAAIEYGAVRSISLRSCSVGASGAVAMGKALGKLASNYRSFAAVRPTTTATAVLTTVEVDLSGNILGSYKIEKPGAKYSASALTSKASAKTASYMNFIGKKIKNVSEQLGASSMQALGSDSEDEDKEITMMEIEESKGQYEMCGISSLCAALIQSIGEGSIDARHKGREASLKIKLGLRMCNLGEGGANALAAAIITLRDNCGVQLLIDPAMNMGIGGGSLEALTGNDESGITLADMARLHFDEMEAARKARQRAAEYQDVLREEGELYDFINESSDFGSFHGTTDETDDSTYDSYD